MKLRERILTAWHVLRFGKLPQTPEEIRAAKRRELSKQAHTECGGNWFRRQSEIRRSRELAAKEARRERGEV